MTEEDLENARKQGYKEGLRKAKRELYRLQKLAFEGFIPPEIVPNNLLDILEGLIIRSTLINLKR